MAIAAQRFKFLDEETNVPVTNFISGNSSDILNKTYGDITKITDQISDAIDGNKWSQIPAILSKINRLPTLITTRLTRDFYSSVNDISNLASNQIHGLSRTLFPGDPVLQNAFNQIGDGCKNKLLSGLSKCLNKRNIAHHNGKKRFTNNRSCSADSFVNLINRLTNGIYKPSLLDQCAMMKMIAGVAIRGFEIGLPMVFSALSGNITDKNLLAQTGGLVLNTVARDGNMYAVMDVANSDVGPMIRSFDPNIAGTVMSNFAYPGEIMDRDKVEFYSEFSSSMNRLDPNWVSNGSVPSIENLNPELSASSDLFNCYGNSISPTVSFDGSVPTPSNESYLYSAISLNPGDSRSSLSNDLGYIPQSSNGNYSESSRIDYNYVDPELFTSKGY